MRRLAILGSIVTLMGAWSWADTTPPPSGSNNGAGQPCKQIEQACTSAGFVKGEAAQGKGLYKNCVQPILKGQSVNGVTVDPSVVSACKERMAKRHAHKHGSQGNQSGGNGKGTTPPAPASGSAPKGDSDGAAE